MMENLFFQFGQMVGLTFEKLAQLSEQPIFGYLLLFLFLFFVPFKCKRKPIYMLYMWDTCIGLEGNLLENHGNVFQVCLLGFHEEVTQASWLKLNIMDPWLSHRSVQSVSGPVQVLM